MSDKRVIEAAAKAEHDRVQSVYDTGLTWEQLPPSLHATWMRSAATMVRAADAARAPEIIAAVDRYQASWQRVVDAKEWWWTERSREALDAIDEALRERYHARRDLLATCGITEASNGR